MKQCFTAQESTPHVSASNPSDRYLVAVPHAFRSGSVSDTVREECGGLDNDGSNPFCTPKLRKLETTEVLYVNSCSGLAPHVRWRCSVAYPLRIQFRWPLVRTFFEVDNARVQGGIPTSILSRAAQVCTLQLLKGNLEMTMAIISWEEVWASFAMVVGRPTRSITESNEAVVADVSLLVTVGCLSDGSLHSVQNAHDMVTLSIS